MTEPTTDQRFDAIGESIESATACMKVLREQNAEQFADIARLTKQNLRLVNRLHWALAVALIFACVAAVGWIVVLRG